MQRFFSGRPRLGFLLAAVLLGLLYFFVLFKFQHFPKNALDPDRYYHLAFAREMAQGEFIVSSLPQAEDIGWEKNFADKEFLFHVLCGAAYRIAGEYGVMALVPILGLGIFWSLLNLLRGFVGLRLAFLGAASLMASSAFIHRLALLRPHSLAILTSIWILYGLLKNRPRVLFLSCVLFQLAYHAFYIPIFFMLPFVALSIFNRKPWLKMVYAGGAGLILGALINPYFPSNILLGFQHLQIATGWGIPKTLLHFGAELYNVTTDQWFRMFLIPVLTAIVAFSRVKFKTDNLTRQHLNTTEGLLPYVFLTFSFFLALTFFSPRASEYLFPLSAILLTLSLNRATWTSAAVIACIALLAQLTSPFPTLKDVEERAKIFDLPFPAIEAIPERAGTKVYTSAWDYTPMLFYKRPDLRFVDLLDPSFLYFNNRPLAILRDSLEEGKIADPYSVLKSRFRADFALVEFSLMTQLETDPNFERLYPKGPWNEWERFHLNDQKRLSLYALRKNRVSNQILSFEAAPLPGQRFGEFNIVSIDHWEDLSSKSPYGEPPAMLDLRRWYAMKFAKALGSPVGELCIAVRPRHDSMEQHSNAEFVGLGGGQKIQLWLNERLIYSTQKESWEGARLMDVLVPLPAKLKSSDRLLAVVCGDGRAKFHSISLSLWNIPDLEKVCSDRFRLAQASHVSGREQWQFCLAPTASPLVTASQKSTNVSSPPRVR